MTSVSVADVQHLAVLARLEMSEYEAGRIAAELSGILGQLESLAALDDGSTSDERAESSLAMPLRADQGPPVPLVRSLDSFAPLLREGFFIVPRLATHEDPVS